MSQIMKRRSPLALASVILALTGACAELPTTATLQARRFTTVSVTGSAMPVHEIAPGMRGIATDINERGAITGYVGPVGDERAFIWHDGVLTTLPLPPGATSAQSVGINIHGHLAVTGRFMFPAGSRAFLWKPESGYTDVGTLGGPNAQALGLNDLDQIVGYSTDGVVNISRGFVWTPGSSPQLVSALAPSQANAINNAGDILISASSTVLLRRGDDGALVTLRGGLGASGLNELSQSAGTGLVGTALRVFSWDRDGNPTEIGPGRANDINDFGLIVGDVGFNPLAWSDGREYLLARFDGNAAATGVNNAGRIAGWAARAGIGNTPVYWDFDPKPNEPPVANAGPDQTLACALSGVTATLDGSGSSDPDGTIASHAWLSGATQLSSLVTHTETFTTTGTHVFTLRVTDDAGATAEDAVQVSIVDDAAPSLAATVAPAAVWPPTGAYQRLSLAVTASDACDPAVSVSATIVSGEPDASNGTTADIRVEHDAAGGGTVTVSSDASRVIAFDPRADVVWVRSERDGSGTGRVYTIVLTATDASGNSASSTVQVTVAHDRRPT